MTDDTDSRVARRLADLTAERAAIPDDGDLPISTTRAQLDELAERRRALDARIEAIRAAVERLEAVGTDHDDTRWQAFLTSARKALCDELISFGPSPIRDRALRARHDDTAFGLRLIDFGM